MGNIPQILWGVLLLPLWGMGTAFAGHSPAAKTPSGNVVVIPEKNNQFLPKDYPTICAFMGVEPTDPGKVDGEDLSNLIFAGKWLQFPGNIEEIFCVTS